MTPEITATVIATDAPYGTEPLLWSEVCQRFDAERWYWLATGGCDGRPHVRPVLAVWLDDRIVSTTSPTTRKGKNLERRPACALTARAEAIDIVVEGLVRWIDDRQILGSVAAAYDNKYGWPVTITQDNMFDAPYGAPTAGRPPYQVYEILPTLVYAFGTSNNLGERSTLFRFTR
jgi:hypothetical protein